VTGAGLGDAFLPKILLSGLFAVGLGTGEGVATVTGEAAGDGLFFGRVFFGLPPGEAPDSGVALGDTAEAGDGLAFSVFFARRCFGLADGVGDCE
jgi:hypothetical protein